MPKVDAAKIALLGFTAEMFTIPAGSDFETLLGAVITEQSALLAARIGAVYDSATSPDKENVERAEKVLVAAELCSMRITTLLDQAVANGEELKTGSIERQRKHYRDEAERLFPGCSGVSDSGFASGALVSSHFDGA